MMISVSKGRRFPRQPGARWAYGRTVGLDVVARIIEIVSGTLFNEFIQERIFDPLDMKDSHWNLPEEKIPRLVVVRGDKGSWRKPTRYFSGSTGLISTARDYLHFEQMLLNGGTLFGNRLLKPSSVALMSTNHVGSHCREKGDIDGVGFGYTVAITLGYAILTEAALGFIGVGIQPPTPTWANMLQQAYPMLDQHPLLFVVPGLAIFVLVLAFNFVGDALRDVLDPRLKGVIH